VEGGEVFDFYSTYVFSRDFGKVELIEILPFNILNPSIGKKKAKELFENVVLKLERKKEIENNKIL